MKGEILTVKILDIINIYIDLVKDIIYMPLCDQSFPLTHSKFV